MHVRSAVFDFDGTLLNSKWGIVNCFRKVGAEFGLDTRGIEDWIIGPPADESMRRLMPDASEPRRQEFLAAFRTRYAIEGWDECSLYEEVPGLLAELQSCAIPCYLCTSKRHDLTLRLLDHLQIGTYFSAVTGDKDDLKSHDKRDLLAGLIAEQRIDTGHCAMIGDSRYDIEAAHAAGVKAVAVLYGYGRLEELLAAKADAYCESPGKVMTALRQL